MLKIYFKIILRNMFRHTFFTFINIFGLAMGLTVTLLVALWIHDELNYNNYQKNLPDICRVVTELEGDRIPTTPGPMAAFLKDNFPEVEKATRLRQESAVLKYGEKSIRVIGLYTEPSFFDIFTFSETQGDSRQALDNSNMLVLTKSTADKLFGKENPVGKTIIMSNKYPFTVGGVVEDVPGNTDPPFKFEFLAPYKIYYSYRDPDNWRGSWDYQTWVRLVPYANIKVLNQKIDKIWKTLVPKDAPKIEIFLQPFSDVHLQPNTTRWDNGHGDIKYVYIFFFMALIIMLIACINYVNLYTAQSLTRIKEISIRKIVGASRRSLFLSGFTESMMFTVFAVPCALLMSGFALPYFNQLSGKELVLNFADPWLIYSGSAIILLTGFLSSIYPALFLSGILTTNSDNKTALSGQIKNGSKQRSTFRNILVTGQFALAIIAMICTLVIARQMNFIADKNPGFDKENIIYLSIGNDNNIAQYNALKTEIKKLPEVIDASYSNSIPTTIDYIPRIRWMQNGEEKSGGFGTYQVDADYLKTMRFQLNKGRFFNDEMQSDKDHSVVINQAAQKAMALTSPLGNEIEIDHRKLKIIGVINDYHFQSFRDEIKPLFLVAAANGYVLNIRISPVGLQNTIGKIKDVVRKQMPGLPFEWHFLDKQIEQLYQSDRQMMKIFSISALLAIFTSCLGLLGLVSFLFSVK